mmetsp:Transcript_7606/g.17511  ORF Transcript_7606/g.17511 Transcript_7606/m.17511 type:complete len:693 (+) Transcript_7606:47-2125(+)
MALTLVVDEVAVEVEESVESEYLAHLRKEGVRRHALDQFPGGAQLLRSVLSQLTELPPGGEPEKADLPRLTEPRLSPTSLGDYLEAATFLGCPKLLRCLPLNQELRSRQALTLLEQVVRLSGSRQVSNAVDEALKAIAGHFCSCLDYRDLRLGDSLASGSVRVSLEVLNQHRRRRESPSPGREATRTGTATPSLSGYSATQAERAAPGLEWSEHKFAVHVLQRQLSLALEEAVKHGRTRIAPPKPDRSLLGMDSDEEVEAEVVGIDAMEDRLSDLGGLVTLDAVEDISEEDGDAVPDDLLAPLAGLAAFLDTASTPPITGAVAVRALLLGDETDLTQRLFRDLFHRDKKLQWMVVSAEIPANYLREVSWHPASSVTLRRMLAGYGKSSPGYIADLIEDLLFGELLDEPHSEQLILEHGLAEKLLLWIQHDAKQGGSAEDAERMHQVGKRLFQVCFLPQNGFLPREDGGACPWDDGSLEPSLLAEVPLTEDSLALCRAVLLRHLLVVNRAEASFQDEAYAGFVHELARLWPLGRWKNCKDQTQIREAFLFLANYWKALASLPSLGDLQHSWSHRSSASSREGLLLIGAGSRRRAEELLLQMFSDLEVWRLPQHALLTPWIPGQVLAAHITAQCKELEDRQLSLVNEARENLEEIGRLTTVVSQLKSRLEATDLRSTQCMQKQAEVNNTLRHLQ